MLIFTSILAKDPNPRGSLFSLLTPRLRILSLGMLERETGTSSNALLNRFRISMFSRLAMAGGTLNRITVDKTVTAMRVAGPHS